MKTNINNYTFNTSKNTYMLTQHGIKEINFFLSELKAKRKEILNAKKDTTENTILPTIKDILSDMAWVVEESKEEEYCNNWGVTDSYESDYPLHLTLNEHYVRI